MLFKNRFVVATFPFVMLCFCFYFQYKDVRVVNILFKQSDIINFSYAWTEIKRKLGPKTKVINMNAKLVQQ